MTASIKVKARTLCRDWGVEDESREEFTLFIVSAEMGLSTMTLRVLGLRDV
jgi:hypothetical protein